MPDLYRNDPHQQQEDETRADLEQAQHDEPEELLDRQLQEQAQREEPIPSDPADYLGTNGHATAQVADPEYVNPHLTATVPEGSTELEMDDRQPEPAPAGADRATDEADGKPEPTALALDDGEANTGNAADTQVKQVHEGWTEAPDHPFVWSHGVTGKFTFSLADGKLDNMRYDTVEEAVEAQTKYAGQQ